MRKKYEAAMTGLFMYAIAVVLILVGTRLLSRGNFSVGTTVGLLGVLCAYSWNKYSKSQRRKAEMRDAFIEAQEERDWRK